MPYIMNIGFDNSARLYRNVYYFEYRGIRFKLIQNNIRKWRDSLLTIVPDYQTSMEKTYLIASDFLTALSWENESRIKLMHQGGISCSSDFRLRRAKGNCFTSPEIPFHPIKVGYDICKIPKVETDEQRIALMLYREALSSNNMYLSFMFYWQVLEVRNSTPDEVKEWINEVYEDKENYNKLLISEDIVSKMPLREKSLGEYLYNDCRNAIAHVKRYPGQIEIKYDSLEDNLRITVSKEIIKKLAKFYIEEELDLNKKMYLVKKNSAGFPVFESEEYMKQNRCDIAYKEKVLTREQIRKKKWYYASKQNSSKKNTPLLSNI